MDVLGLFESTVNRLAWFINGVYSRKEMVDLSQREHENCSKILFENPYGFYTLLGLTYMFMKRNLPQVFAKNFF